MLHILSLTVCGEKREEPREARTKVNKLQNSRFWTFFWEGVKRRKRDPRV